MWLMLFVFGVVAGITERRCPPRLHLNCLGYLGYVANLVDSSGIASKGVAGRTKDSLEIQL